MGFLITTTGPFEPKGFPDIRARYYRTRRHTGELELRISRTDSGMEFLARVRRLRPAHHDYIHILEPIA